MTHGSSAHVHARVFMTAHRTSCRYEVLKYLKSIQAPEKRGTAPSNILWLKRHVAAAAEGQEVRGTE